MVQDIGSATEQLVGVGKTAIDQLAGMIRELTEQLASDAEFHTAERTQLEIELAALRERHAELSRELDLMCAHATEMQAEIEAVKARLEIAERLSAFDPLTEIPNESQLRVAVHESIKQYARVGHDARFCVLMIDLDDFKIINDQDKSHQDGDGALRHFAQQGLEAVRRPQDLAVRKGGDEFAVLLHGCGLEGARAFQDRLREAMTVNQFVTERGRVYEIRFSVGAAFYEEGDSYETLLARADRACYEHKEERKGKLRASDEPTGEVFLDELLFNDEDDRMV